jgi:hypothetical protein
MGVKNCCTATVVVKLIAAATVFRSVQGSYEGFCFMKSLRGYLKHNRNIDKEFIIFGVGENHDSWE